MRRNDLGSRVLKIESQNPFARDIPTVDVWRLELPTSRRLQGEVGKVSAWPRRIEHRSHDGARRINRDSHADSYDASKGVPRLLWHAGQDLPKDFAPNKITVVCLRLRPGWKGKSGRNGATGAFFIADSLPGLFCFRRDWFLLRFWLKPRLIGRAGGGSLSLRATVEQSWAG